MKRTSTGEVKQRRLGRSGEELLEWIEKRCNNMLRISRKLIMYKPKKNADERFKATEA